MPEFAEHLPMENKGHVEDAYDLLASLPDDQDLRETIKSFADDREVWLRARLATASIDGLPDAVTKHWPKSVLIEVSPDDQPDDPEASDIDNIVRAAEQTTLEQAYSLSLEAGFRTGVDRLPSMWIKAVERSSGFAIHLRRPGKTFNEDFYLDDGFGGNIGRISQEDVTRFLVSITNVKLDRLADLPDESLQQILLHNIGEMYPGSRRKSEFRLTALLGKASIEHPADNYAGIVLIEDIEAKKGTNTTFILERLLDYPDFGTKVTRRLIAEYFDDCGPHHDEESEHEPVTHTKAPRSKITLIKTMASEKDYTIESMSSSSHLIGDRAPLELTIEQGEGAAIQDILEQVVAAVSDRFMPTEKPAPELLPEIPHPTEKQL